MKKRTTRQSLLTSTLALLLCFAMLLGSTFAWFTDSVTSSGNKIVSGTLKVDLELLDKDTNKWSSIKESQDPIFAYTKWEPGFTDVKLLKVDNEGNLALKWKAVFAAENELSDLANVIDVYVLPYGVLTEELAAEKVAYPTDRALKDYQRVGTLAEFVKTIEATTYGSLKAGESAYLGLALKMQESAGNEYKEKDLGGTFDIRIVATQDTVEADGFGNDYDADALFPLTPGKYYSASAPVSVDTDGKVLADTALGASGDRASAIIPAGVEMESGATAATLDITVVTEYQAVVNAKGGDVIYPLDIHIKGVSKENTVPMRITLNEMFPKGYANYNIKLVHVENGVSVDMIPVDSMGELDAHNEFYYDPATGEVTVALASFSEVTAAVANDNPWNGTAVDTSWYNTTDKEFVLNDAADLAGFAQIVGGMATGIERDSFAGKTVKLGANLNMGGDTGTEENPVIFTPVGYYFTNDKNGNGTPNENKADIYSDVYSFEGTFDGQGYTISNILQRTWDIKGDDPHYSVPAEQYYNDGMGIFGFVYNGTVKNLDVVGFESDGEFCTTGCVAAYSAGVSTFENIRITNCNPRAYNVPNGGVVGYAYDESEATENKIVFKNVTVDPTTKITALWGSWDVGCGGILGRLGDTTKLVMEDCTVGALIDVYNDVCANYQYYQYRYCGMLIGTVGSDGDTSNQEANMTFTNVKVYYGDWSQDNNYYCELVENTIASYTHDYQFSRLTKLNTIGQIKDLNGNWNQTGNFVVVDDDGVATCYHIRTDANGNYYEHKHADKGTETVDGVEVLVEDKQCVHIPFKQFYAGYGWGADHSYEIATVAEAKYTITFMNSDGKTVLDVQYITDANKVFVDAYDDIAFSFLDSSYANEFGGWSTAGSVKTTEIPAGNTANFVLYPTHLTKYTARFVDEDGNVINTQTFNKNTSKLIDVAGPASAADVLVFDHWEVRNADGTSTSLSEYKFKNASGDITIYPYYAIKTGALGLTGVDTNGDGIVDYYTVEAVDAGNIGTDVTIPGNINGVPVKVITDLSSGWATNVENVVIKEGVEEIKAEAFAGTTNLSTVELPSTITKIEDNAFYDSSWIGSLGNAVGREKKLTITYNGTKADWDKVVANSNSNSGNGKWEEGLASGTKVVCTDGVYTMTREGWIYYTYTWTWQAN